MRRMKQGTGRFDVVAFDWDGTLMDSTALIAACIQAACADLDLPIPPIERATHVVGLGLMDALAYAVPEMPPALAPQMAARYRHHYLAHDRELLLFDGARDVLKMLHDAGLLIAVATGKPRVGLDRALAATGLAPLFHATRCADESRTKPHPQMLFDLADTLGVRVDRLLMVGDTTHDLLMASQAGAPAVAVSYGAHPERSLEGHGALAVVGSMAQLRTWLATHV